MSIPCGAPGPGIATGLAAGATPIVITLLGEPQGKGRPRFRVVTTKAGKTFPSVYTPAATRSYESALGMAGRAAMRAKPPLDEPLEVTILAVMSVPKSWSMRKRDAALAGIIRPTGSPDCDNIGKTKDGLNGIVWTDDKLIVDERITKRYGEKPMLRIEVRLVGAFS